MDYRWYLPLCIAWICRFYPVVCHSCIYMCLHVCTRTMSYYGNQLCEWVVCMVHVTGHVWCIFCCPTLGGCCRHPSSLSLPLPHPPFSIPTPPLPPHRPSLYPALYVVCIASIPLPCPVCCMCCLHPSTLPCMLYVLPPSLSLPPSLPLPPSPSLPPIHLPLVVEAAEQRERERKKAEEKATLKKLQKIIEKEKMRKERRSKPKKKYVFCDWG